MRMCTSTAFLACLYLAVKRWQARAAYLESTQRSASNTRIRSNTAARALNLTKPKMHPTPMATQSL
jgi:hypothetical protein